MEAGAQPSRLLRFALVSSALCLVVLFTGCSPWSATEEDHVQRASELEAAGDPRAAAIEWKNVLQLNPTNAEARLRLGVVSLELGDLATAQSELQRAADLGLATERIALPQARLALLRGEYAQVLERLDPAAFTTSDAAGRAEGLLLRGEALAALDQRPEAMEAFDQALQIAPHLALPHVAAAAVHLSLERPDEARARLHTALEMNPRLHQAWNLLGDLERSEGRLSEADTAYGEAIEHGPSPYFFHIKRSLTRMALGDADGVGADLAAMRRLGPREPGTAYIQGLVSYQKGKYADATAAFEEALSRSPEFQPAVFFLGASQFAQQRWQQAEFHLDRFLRAHPESDEAARLLAMVRLREGDLARAEDLLLPVLGRSPDDVLALNLMGNLYLARGENDQGISHLRRLTAVQPEDVGARAALAAGLLHAGQREEGLLELESAIELAPGQHGLEIAYIIRLLQGGDYDKALEAIAVLAQTLPEEPLLYNLRAAGYLGAGDVGSARAALQEALRVAPGDPGASTNLARISLQQGDRDEAVRLYRNALRHHAGHPGVSVLLAQLKAEAGDRDTMRAVLERAIEANPQALAPRLALGRDALSHGDARRTLELLEPVREAAANNIQMLDLLANAQIAAGQHALAVNTIRTLATRTEEDADNLTRLGFGFERAASPADARRHYRRALELEPSHLRALQLLGALELREGRHEEALVLARHLQEINASAATGHTLEGSVHLAEGRYEEAAAALQQAHDLQPSAETTIALGLAWQQIGEAGHAAELLRSRLAEQPNESGVHFQLAQALLALGDYAEAIREYEALEETQADNVVILNNLAFLYQAGGDPRALEYAERAYGLMPDNPAIADTLGWILVREGNIERGLPLLETARRSLPENPDVRYHYAAALAEAGREANARHELATLLNEVESFPQRAKAQALLQRLR